MSETNDSAHRILVIDDETAMRDGCRRVLEAEGYPTQVAASADQGLEMLGAGDYDVVYVDLKMPGKGGMEFLVEAQKLDTDAVCVVITAYATLETAVEATKRGAYDFIAKPFTPDELVSVTRKALERVRLVRERNRLRDERERRLLELATEKGRLRSIVEAMTDGVLVTNREGQLVLYNAAALQVVSCPAPGSGPNTVDTCVRLPELVALIGEAQTDAEARRLTREIRVGEEEHEVVMASANPVMDDDGRYLGTVTVLSDVSELKLVEHVKAQFVNMVAHELRAPLAAIDGYIKVILDGIGSDPEQVRRMLNRSHDRLQGLLDLVSDLLAVSRLETGVVHRTVSPISVAEMARNTQELMAPMAEKAQVALRVEVPEALPDLEGDPAEITVVLDNLVSNAIKYNRPGGTVTISLSDEAPYLALEVADTGLGISPEGQKRIFDDFFREKTEENKLVVGTGLGLSIVKRVVERYHGDIVVRSAPGEGSVFKVRLPFSQASVC